jgi:hypothetical protein
MPGIVITLDSMGRFSTVGGGVTANVGVGAKELSILGFSSSMSLVVNLGTLTLYATVSIQNLDVIKSA